MSCKYLHFSPSYTVNDSSTQVVFGFANPVNATDRDRFCWRITTDIPSGTPATYSVYVTVNGANIPVLNKYGNPVIVSDLARGQLYKGFFGATTPHIIVTNVPKTVHCGCNNVL